MNRLHRWLCTSDRWRSTLRQRFPWVIADTDLGPNVLEIGSGPGLTTDLLRTSVPRMTALEIDAKSAASLGSRLAKSNVRVIEGDAAGFFFSVLPPTATRTHRPVSLPHLGAVVLAVAVVSLGMGLIKAA
jgi:SAM-dependent methyltransferase